MMAELLKHIDDSELRQIAGKIESGIRITSQEGLMLYEKAGLPLLGLLSSIVRKRKNGTSAYYIRNFHIEPTNQCIHNCLFCSYRRPAGDPESWEYSEDEILEIVKRFDNKPVTEVHIVGGVHPSHDLHYYGRLLRKIKEHRPSLHIKAFSAIELEYMIKMAGMQIEEGLRQLKDYGLDSIPGGGAEIFHPEVREKICNDKTSAENWLLIHETAHRLGIPSNATMLYGHMESYAHRIDHMNRIRNLQDITGGFNAFIPLKYKSSHNSLSHLKEVSITEDLRNYAVSRILLDNIPHLKAYWPMAGKEVARLSLSFGADDLDGTIDDTTKIYSMAGADEKNPAMTSGEISKLITEAGFHPVERDSLFNKI